MTRTWPVFGLVFAAIWVFVRGPALAPEPVAGSLLAGLAVGLPVAFVFRRLYAPEIDLSRALRGGPAALRFVVVFAKDIVVANFDVAYRVLAPAQPIEPQVILVPLRVETDLGVTTLANAITLTPGTMTLDYDQAENALFVHIIDGRNPEAVVEPIREWEDALLVTFDEPGSPDDPHPAITVHPPEEAMPVTPATAIPPGADRESYLARTPTGERDRSAAEQADDASDADGGEGDGR
ncbi:Na+/H+ antiporter subunit E [Halobacteriales archaeon Cl-PHB]